MARRHSRGLGVSDGPTWDEIVSEVLAVLTPDKAVPDLGHVCVCPCKACELLTLVIYSRPTSPRRGTSPVEILWPLSLNFPLLPPTITLCWNLPGLITPLPPHVEPNCGDSENSGAYVCVGT